MSLRLGLATLALAAGAACSTKPSTPAKVETTTTVEITSTTTVASTKASTTTTTAAPTTTTARRAVTTTAAYVATTTTAGHPAGASALCNDGTYSYSQTHSGSCSHHGGVRQFYS